MANVVGQRVRRREDPRFITGKGQYVDDLPLPGALHLTFVRSPWAHARIVGIDAAEARALPDVQVFTAADLGLGKTAPSVHPDGRALAPPVPGQRQGAVRRRDRRGGARADPRASVDAAELVAVEYDPLPVVTEPQAALEDEMLLFEEAGTNVCGARSRQSSDEELFDGCEVTSSGTVTSQRIAACPIEPRATAARFGEDGRLTIWLSTQTPHQDRDGLASALGIEPEAIRVIAPDVGGGFGAKGLSVEDVVVAAIARATGRPVRWTETRSENLVAMRHGRAQRIDFRIGGGRDGTVQALRLSLLQDAGAYPGIGAFLPNLTALMASGVYRIPKIDVELQSVVTNTTPTGAVRGAGRPEATQSGRARDRHVRGRARRSTPPRCAGGTSSRPTRSRSRRRRAPTTTSATTAGRSICALEHAGYEQLRAEQAARRSNGGTKQLGIGLSTYVEITNGIGETEFGAVEITADGRGDRHAPARSRTARVTRRRLRRSRPTGWGSRSSGSRSIKGDTDAVPRGTGTYGSKSTQIGGVAASQASEELVELAKELAAEELEASPEDMVLDLDAGRFHVAGAPEPGLSWGELAGRLEAQGRLRRAGGRGRLGRLAARRSRSARTWRWSRSTPRPARSRYGG